MDPLSIAGFSLGLAKEVGDLALSITKFCREFRDAKSDLDTVLRELQSLRTVLELVADATDSEGLKDLIPPDLKDKIDYILRGCKNLVDRLRNLLRKYRREGLMNKAKWVLYGKDECGAIRSSLDHHKATLDIVLETISLIVTYGIKQDTTVIRQDTSILIGQTTVTDAKIDRILLLLDERGSKVASSHELGLEDRFLLQRYLHDLTSYAGSYGGSYAGSYAGSDYEGAASAQGSDLEEDFDDTKSDSTAVQATQKPTESDIAQQQSEVASALLDDLPPISADSDSDSDASDAEMSAETARSDIARQAFESSSDGSTAIPSTVPLTSLPERLVNGGNESKAAISVSKSPVSERQKLADTTEPQSEPSDDNNCSTEPRESVPESESSSDIPEVERPPRGSSLPVRNHMHNSQTHREAMGVKQSPRAAAIASNQLQNLRTKIKSSSADTSSGQRPLKQKVNSSLDGRSFSNYRKPYVESDDEDEVEVGPVFCQSTDLNFDPEQQETSRPGYEEDESFDPGNVGPYSLAGIPKMDLLLAPHPECNSEYLNVQLRQIDRNTKPEYVKKLLDAGADANISPGLIDVRWQNVRSTMTEEQLSEDKYLSIYNTPLQNAVASGNDACVKLLLREGADMSIWAETGYRKRPLHIAIMGEHLRIMKRLIAASSKAKVVGDDLDFSPIHLAVLSRKPSAIAMINLLAKNMAYLNAYRNPKESNLLMELIDASTDDDLHNSLPIIRRLMTLGVELDPIDYPLRTSSSQKHTRPLLAAIYGRVHHQPNPPIISHRPSNKLSALRERLVELLLNNGASVRPMCFQGQWVEDALIIATRQSLHGLMKLLLDRGADPNLNASLGCKGTALHAAAKRLDLTAIEMLIKHGAKPNVKAAGREETPLQTALIVFVTGTVKVEESYLDAIIRALSANDKLWYLPHAIVRYAVPGPDYVWYNDISLSADDLLRSSGLSKKDIRTIRKLEPSAPLPRRYNPITIID